jgi:hypothetical protein
MHRRALSRLSVPLLVAAGAATVLLLVRGIGAEPLTRVEKPVVRAAVVLPSRPAGATVREAPREGGEMGRIGSFVEPGGVPAYEILERRPDERDGARALRLLVDTRSRGQEDLTLIARDLKVRYAGYDAVSAQFTDTTDVLDYNGGALIFNTYEGVTYLGYIYGPPNMDGYYVRAAD